MKTTMKKNANDDSPELTNGSSITTIDSLPNFVLGMIFSLVEFEGVHHTGAAAGAPPSPPPPSYKQLLTKDTSTPLLSPKSPLGTLAQVCRRWRDLAKQTTRRGTGMGCPLQDDPFAQEFQRFKLTYDPPLAPAGHPHDPNLLLGQRPLSGLRVKWAKKLPSKIFAQNWRLDSKGMATISADGQAVLWDAATGNASKLPAQANSWLSLSCALSPSNRLLAVGGGGGSNLCMIFNISSGTKRKPVTLAGHSGHVHCVRFIDEGHCITCSEDTTCRIWDVHHRSITERYGEHTGDVLCVEVSPADRRVFASCGCDRSIVIWDTRMKSQVGSMRTHEGDVNNVCWSETGLAVASSSDDRTFRLYDLRMTKEIRCLQAPMDMGYCTGVSLTNSGRFLFGSCERHMLVWDLLTSTMLSDVEHSARIAAIDVSMDGTLAATSCYDGVVRMWEPVLSPE